MHALPAERGLEIEVDCGEHIYSQLVEEHVFTHENRTVLFISGRYLAFIILLNESFTHLISLDD